MKWKLALIGFGQVGTGLAQVLLAKETELRDRWDASFCVTILCTGRHGNFHNPVGLPLAEMLAEPRESNAWQNQRTDKSCEELIAEKAADIFCELSPTNLKDAEPALSRCRRILQNGLHLVAANKGPSVLAGDGLHQLANQYNCSYFHEATVMSGSPVFSLIDEALCHCRFISFRGAVNGSSNFILSEMEQGLPYEKAMELARVKGYLEADPGLDIDGWDSTAKAIILARHLFNQHRMPAPTAVLRQGIRDFSIKAIQAARIENHCWRLISQGSIQDGHLQLEVAPQKIALDDPLSKANGATSALTLATDLLGAVTLTGPGAGSTQTAAGVLSDLLRIHRRFGQL